MWAYESPPWSSSSSSGASGSRSGRRAPEDDITAWTDTWNENPRSFAWTKTADEILNSLADYLTKVGTAAG